MSIVGSLSISKSSQLLQYHAGYHGIIVGYTQKIPEISHINNKQIWKSPQWLSNNVEHTPLWSAFVWNGHRLLMKMLCGWNKTRKTWRNVYVIWMGIWVKCSWNRAQGEIHRSCQEVADFGDVCWSRYTPLWLAQYPQPAWRLCKIFKYLVTHWDRRMRPH